MWERNLDLVGRRNIIAHQSDRAHTDAQVIPYIDAQRTKNTIYS